MYDWGVPKLIDPIERDAVIASAAWRVLIRDGVMAFSVRNIADEAGLATASLRRRFPTQAALKVFCMRLVIERATARINRVSSSTNGSDLDIALECLKQLLPLDDERRAEMEVFLALGSLAATDDEMGTVYREAHVAIAGVCRSVVELLTGADTAAAHAPESARKLHALLDGLALHLVRQERGADTSWGVRVLEAELGG